MLTAISNKIHRNTNPSITTLNLGESMNSGRPFNPELINNTISGQLNVFTFVG